MRVYGAKSDANALFDTSGVALVMGANNQCNLPL